MYPELKQFHCDESAGVIDVTATEVKGNAEQCMQSGMWTASKL